MSKANSADPDQTPLNNMYTVRLVDSSIVICWASLFVISGMSGLFCRFYYIFDGKSCKQSM